MVNDVIGAAGTGKDELGDRDKGISFLKQGANDTGQGFRGVLGSVVEEDDGAGLHFGGDPLGDLCGGEVLPVQAVPVPTGGKSQDCPLFTSQS